MAASYDSVQRQSRVASESRPRANVYFLPAAECAQVTVLMGAGFSRMAQLPRGVLLRGCVGPLLLAARSGFSLAAPRRCMRQERGGKVRGRSHAATVLAGACGRGRAWVLSVTDGPFLLLWSHGWHISRRSRNRPRSTRLNRSGLALLSGRPFLRSVEYSKMPLLALWASNPEAVSQMSIEQIVATAGDGRLLDDSICAKELREYLTQVSTSVLSDYAEHCLTAPYPKSGLVLQDIVNELGRRLEYDAKNGRYQGTSKNVGFDGIWMSPDQPAVVVEVKTTDAYRISLDTIAAYRDKLQASGVLPQSTSILIVVGRVDTGELEAQVRGSRHAWDMRLISVDSLISLVRVKESTDSGVTAAKIRSILVPMEYTRLDALVDVMFTAAKDVEAAVDSEASEIAIDRGDGEAFSFEFTAPAVIQSVREGIVRALGVRDSKKILRRSRALYWDSERKYRVVCTISKRYKTGAPYWYAYHPAWNDFLGEGETGLFVLGCVDLPVAFALPVGEVRKNLENFNKTITPEGKEYWHVKILEPSKGQFALHLPRSASSIPLEQYRLPVASSQ